MKKKDGKSTVAISLIVLIIVTISIIVAIYSINMYYSLEESKQETEFKDVIFRIQKRYDDYQKNNGNKKAKIEDIIGDDKLYSDKLEILNNEIVYSGESYLEKRWCIDLGMTVLKSYNNPYIPEGFYYVGGDYEKGFVISDNKQDENKGDSYENSKTLKGNQFVWIPVDGEKIKFNKVESNKNKGEITLYSDMTTKDINTAKIIEKSVTKYGGFYIGRYESYVEKDKVQIKADLLPTSDIKYKDAEKYAKNMYKNSDDIYSIIPTGKMWDTALENMRIHGNIPKDSINKNSEAYGNYSNNDLSTEKNVLEQHYKEVETLKLLKTGESYLSEMFGTFDMAGNLAEWTSESYNLNYKAIRGGSYKVESSEEPVSFRNGILSPNKGYSDVGFRVALYIK